eukprot:CAMPEP_0172578512 /NCGR_PEP_ID=MMETSP1067-20121228/138774_1 /TAXON_ID=265564 ORGANISM="Thalassiosira punctigera, Strain Tpunct2005C2" /NCGR_SAMPLE_ID=MMETSP1067 /ASSEMBLY_ACC=CAM_ASM_000444 /LENGTH=412 /DNA_ID=CAMNT_0013371209 /DNA_START=322 /DNA_END=1560 /DNA_ORIENTATION=-
MADLCRGLEHNESISEFEISDCLLRNAEIQSLAPFVRKNPSLHTLNIDGCLGEGGVDLLSSALMSRTHSIENISLDGNCMGSEDSKESFDAFIAALNNNKELTRASLMGNQIGKHGVASLARLLKNPDSKLKSLILRHNCIDNECAAILAESLLSNTKLNNIDLDRNERVSSKGLMAFLHVISRTPDAPIHLTVRWRFPSSTDEMSAIVNIRLNEPLHSLAAQLSANQYFIWASDMSKVKLHFDGKGLDCSETPFFYCMKEGDVVDVVTDSIWGRNLIEGSKVGLDVNWGKNINGVRGTIASNHTLSSLGYETALRRNFPLGHLLREFLEANKRTPSSSARVKVFRCHVQHNLSLEDLCEMDTVMPRVLAWIGCALGETDKERTFSAPPPPTVVRLGAIYHVLRAMPMLCGF